MAVEFSTRAFARDLDGRMADRLARDGAAIKAEAYRLLSTPGPPPSEPGEPPHRGKSEDKESLRGTLYMEVDTAALTLRVGATAPQALWMELGTVAVAPRPWLAPAVDAVVGDAGVIEHDSNGHFG